MSLKLPSITPLQYLVLSAVFEREARGREIREVLGDHGAQSSLPAFYQLMARLEEGKLVKGRRAEFNSGSYVVREKLYKITAKGKKIRQECIDFYNAHSPHP